MHTCDFMYNKSGRLTKLAVCMSRYEPTSHSYPHIYKIYTTKKDAAICDISNYYVRCITDKVQEEKNETKKKNLKIKMLGKPRK